jgi:uncharacterized protein YndB with AHSA1/START domain
MGAKNAGFRAAVEAQLDLDQGWVGRAGRSWPVNQRATAMNDNAPGEISILGDEARVRFERVFDHPPQRVWAALTIPSWLVQWLAPGAISVRLGGTVMLDFGDSGVVIDSVITAFAPGRLMEYSWSGPGEPLRPVRWELTAAQNGTCLTLTLELPACEDIARSSAGWEAHLDMLAAALEGVPIKFPFQRFKACREGYKRTLGPASA